MEDKEVIFREVQRLGPRSLRATVLFALLVVVVVWVLPLCAGVYHGVGTQRFYPRDLLAEITCLAIGVGLLLVLYLPKLVTEVRSDGLYVRFFPFHLSFRRIRLDDVTRCDAVTYRPILQYGGWGITGGRRSRAYNVSGNRGLRIDYADATHLLIGSQRPEELAHAIRSLMEHTSPD